MTTLGKLRTQQFLGAGLILFALSGCVYLSPHENFVHNIQAMVGKNFKDIMSSAGWGWNKPSEINPLPNGNLSYRFHYRLSCYYIFEVNPQANIVIEASWEGSEHDCGMAP